MGYWNTFFSLNNYSLLRIERVGIEIIPRKLLERKTVGDVRNLDERLGEVARLAVKNLKILRFLINVYFI